MSPTLTTTGAEAPGCKGAEEQGGRRSGGEGNHMTTIEDVGEAFMMKVFNSSFRRTKEKIRHMIRQDAVDLLWHPPVETP